MIFYTGSLKCMSITSKDVMRLVLEQFTLKIHEKKNVDE